MLSLSSLSYRAVAPDLRGFGDTDAPPSHTSYTVFHIVGDLVGFLDALSLDKIFLVIHDWGPIIAWYFCPLRPDRFKALVNTSVVFHPRNPTRKPLHTTPSLLGENNYICGFQEREEESKKLKLQKVTEEAEQRKLASEYEQRKNHRISLGK